MEYKQLSATKFLTILAAVVLVYYYRENGEDDPARSVLTGLLRAEKRLPTKDSVQKKVAIGFGSCMDIFTRAMPFVDEMGINPPETPLHHDVLDSNKGLAEILAYFFEYGAAAERYVSDRDLFNSWTDAAKQMDISRFLLGGNAPAMANRFAIEGCSVLLGSKMSTEAAKHLHTSIKLASNATSDQVDDIHLIFEYDKGEKWGKYESPRGNRLIVHSDYSNLMMESLSDFIAEVVTFKPNLVVVSGLQMMDNFPFDQNIRSNKINEIKNLLISLPKSTLIHFEMASIVEEKFLKEIVNELLPNVDSVGMNEQELANLVGLVTGKSVTHVANANPRVATALDDMRQLLSSLLELQNGSRQLSRLHVHTLAYQAIMTQENSRWKYSEMAAAKAALTANRYVCGSVEIDPNKMRLVLDQSFSVSLATGSERIAVNQKDPVSCWNEKDYNLCVAPNLVCTHILQTGGAGDNISAAGIASQL